MTFLKDYNFLQHFRKQEQIHFLESYKTDLPADSRFAKTFVGTTTKDGTLKLNGFKECVELTFEKEGYYFSKQIISSYKELEVQGYYSLYGYVKVDKVAVSGNIGLVASTSL